MQGLSVTAARRAAWVIVAWIVLGSLAYAQEEDAAPAAPEGEAAQPAGGPPPAEPETKSHLVAVMQLTVDGMENSTADGSMEMTIAKAAANLGQRAVDPAASKEFLASEAGRPYAECYSVNCTADAGKGLGVDLVISGNVMKAQDLVKVNLQLIKVAAGKIVSSDKAEIPAGQPLEPMLAESVKRLFDGYKDAPPVAPVAVEDVPEDENPAAEKAKEERFYKGELTTIGPLEIIPLANRAGVVTGYRRLGYNHYVYIEPQVDLRFFPDDITKDSKLRLGFGVPLNLEIFSGEDKNGDEELDKFADAGKPRKQDWDSWRDAAKLIRYIQYGRKEDNLYVNVNRTFAASIGHGIVLKRYIPNLDYFTQRVSAEVDAYWRYGGFEFFTNDITKYNIIGMLAFIKPASFFSDHWMAESLSFGMHYHTDWDAPETVRTNRSASDGSYIYDPVDVHFIGGDVEFKVVRWPTVKPNVDVKVYTDFTQWLDHGGGWTLGALGRFNLYTKIRQAFRARAEFRVFQENYTPSYFDPFYEVMKYKYFSESRPATNKQYTEYTIKTKYLEFTNRPGDWNRVGGYFEFSYALLDYVGLTFAFDGASGSDNGNVLFHVEVPATKYFQVAATYYKTNVETVKNVFDPYASNTMLIALARLRPLQLLAFQFGVRRTVQPSVAYFPNLEAHWDVKADLDISWEF
ncbi:MAG: hypothetical protein C4523_16615 [Myxococcales bacterium]|nr:MAG: hypothetical protein C4523_16615 [Myxococcales bacterium]